jgi:hypothetical protein
MSQNDPKRTPHESRIASSFRHGNFHRECWLLSRSQAGTLRLRKALEERGDYNNKQFNSISRTGMADVLQMTTRYAHVVTDYLHETVGL